MSGRLTAMIERVSERWEPVFARFFDDSRN